MNPAAKAAANKAAHPEQYCAHPRCLWRILTPRGPNPCQIHPLPLAASMLPRIDVTPVVGRLITFGRARALWCSRCVQAGICHEPWDHVETILSGDGVQSGELEPGDACEKCGTVLREAVAHAG